jgi:lysophospholipase L1-like esterase
MASGGQSATGGQNPTGGSSPTGGVASSSDAAAGTAGQDASGATGGQPAGGTNADAAGGGGAGGSTAGAGGQSATGGRNPTGGSSATGGVAPGSDAAAGTAGQDASGATGGQPTGGTNADAAGGGGADGGGAGSGGRSDGGTGGAGGGTPYNPCPSTGACAILPLGDSITAGTGSSDGGGYRVELFKQAVANSQSITFVGTLASGPTTVSGKPFPRSHEGHSGFVIDTIPQRQGLSSVTDAAIAKSIPHIVLLMIGTNDIAWQYDLANEPTRLGNLIDKIIADAPKALVVVAQIGPSNDDARTALIKAYNDGIPAVVQARVAAGKHVSMVDMFTPFVSNVNYKTALLSDEVHPNDAGYVILGQTWYAAIQSFLPHAH